MILSDEKARKWKWVPPVLVFPTGCGILFLILILYKTHFSNQEHVRTISELNAMTYAERMTSDLNRGIAITESLEEILISEEGHISNFHQVASDLMTPAIQSVQPAPKGVVTQIYPEAGNEAGKIDLINDETRGEISRYARDNDVT